MSFTETERLLHKKFTMDDLARLVEIRSDPEVMRFIGGKKMQNPAALEKRLQFYISCYEKRLGIHQVIWKKNGRLIGWSGLQPLEDTGEIEVSYGMIRDYWGRGIGFETARVWLTYGFRQLGLERIVAVADKRNIGSWKIMEKLGMKFEKTTEHYGMNCVYYAISDQEYLRREKG